MWPRSAPQPEVSFRKGGALVANSPLSVIPTHQYSAREELAERTRALLLEAQTAGPLRRQQILDEVVTSYLWLAEKLARQFLHRGEDEEDLVPGGDTRPVEEWTPL